MARRYGGGPAAELGSSGPRRGLNSTEAISGKGYQAGEHHSISTRKIENGYVVDITSCNPGTGEYKCSEIFTKEPPNIKPPDFTGRRGKGINNALSDTKTYLRGR